MTASQNAPAAAAAARYDVADAVVVVTGGGRGLGRAIAEGFAAQGACVVVAGRTAGTIEAAVAGIRERGAAAAGFTVDVASEESVAALCAAVLERYGRVDALINNAGINPWYKAPEDTALAEWQAIIDVNLTGVFLGCKHFGGAMLRRGHGSIVNITSIAGRTGLARTTAYCAAKGGVELMTRSLALDWARRGVRVNAVAPGYFETDLTAGVRAHEGLSRRLTERTPAGRFGRPDELVGACIFLASPAAAYVTGQSIAVDGGWTAA